MNPLSLCGLSAANFCVAAAIFAAPAPPDPVAHHHSSPPAGERAAASELAATAAFDAQARLWVVNQRAGHLEVRRSADFGRSWFGPVRVNATPEDIDPGGDARPKIASGPGGEIFVTWTRALAKPYSGEVRFARSLDGGCTFSPPLVVHRHREEITHRFDAITVDEHGRIFVAWIDKRDAIAAAATRRPYRGAAVYFAVSDDRGAAFRGDFKVADHTCECCRIALASTERNGVLALWRHVFEPNVRDHAMAWLQPDGRVLGFQRATFDDWRVDACPHQGPSVAIDPGGAPHAVWFGVSAEGAAVRYGRLLGPGAASLRRIGGKLAAHADLAVAGKKVAVVWKEFEDGRTHLRALTSEDGGENWREHALAATAEASDQPKVLAHAGRFYAFWNTREVPFVVRRLP